MKETILEYAKEEYAKYGVDIEKAMERVSKIPVSIHCWQGDDIEGFMNNKADGGGIQTTGSYPYSARGFEQLTADFDEVLRLTPGVKRINLHAIYAVTDGEVSLDNLTIEHFRPWLEWARVRGVKIDFNPTLFGHEKVKDGLTLSSPDEETRRFWIRCVQATRKIASEIGKEQGSPCLHNLWIADGFKDTPSDRLTPRLRLKASLDEIYSVAYPQKYIIDSVESKVFGIGVESYTVGSSEFYQAYSAKSGVCALLDNGHFHPQEFVSDKIPSLLAFYDKVALHVTRGVRWDSDHVVILDDETKEIATEIIRNNADERVLIGLDYFDASINRVLAWVTGARNMQKALLYATLQPHEEMKRLQDEADYGAILALKEEIKELPFGIVWNAYCENQGVPTGREVYERIKKYEYGVKAERR